jgi:hypothetical protein
MEDLVIENVRVFFPMEYFAIIGYISFPFDTFCDQLVYFCPFWYVVVRKIWQPSLFDRGLVSK